MKPNETELRQLQIMDERVYKFKKNNFDDCGYDASFSFFAWIVVCSIFPPLLVAWFLWEWYVNLFRKAVIFVNQIILILMRFNYAKLILVMFFVLAVLFILANILK